MELAQKNLGDNETLDSIYNGKIKLFQKKKGYRFSIDAVLLAEFVHKLGGARLLDLGTGCGIVPLMIAHKNTHVNITGVELQDSLYDLAKRNVEENGLTDRIKIIQHDIRHVDRILSPESFDLITANPPYIERDSGRLNPDKEKAIARHELMVSLEEIVRAVKYLLTPTGKAVIIYPAKRAVDLLTLLRKEGIEPKFVQMIHSKLTTEAKLVIVKASKSGKKGGLKVLPPWIIYNEDGNYTDESEKMLNGT
ncbi:tRNA1(Val) (adenine(37)-N6)-methyltransferase [Thermodesulfobacteriota bacterium]